MTEHNFPYIYSRINYAEKKNLYMYSRHRWATFLKDYFVDRNEVLSEIKCKTLKHLDTENSTSIDHIDLQQHDIHALIECLLRTSPNHSEFLRVLLFFLKKFETKGKILANYEDKTACEVSPLDYIKLSYVVSKFLKHTYNAKFMNFFLKLNDKIIFMKNQWIKTQAEPYFFSALSCEIELIRKLQDQII